MTQHIHEVIFLVQANNGVWTPDELTTAITNEWGAEVEFASCSSCISKEEVLQFLLDRQKVVLTQEGKIAIHRDMQMCNGHHHH